MANEPVITIIGNLVADPEVRFLNSGDAVANFTVAQTPRVKDGDQWADGTTTFFRCTAWRKLGENVAESLNKGDRVIVQGGMATDNYTTKDGDERSSLTLRVDNIGPSLEWATATVTKSGGGGGGGGGGQGGSSRGGGGRGGGRGQRSGGQSGGDPWGSAPAGASEGY